MKFLNNSKFWEDADFQSHCSTVVGRLVLQGNRGLGARTPIWVATCTEGRGRRAPPRRLTFLLFNGAVSNRVFDWLV